MSNYQSQEKESSGYQTQKSSSQNTNRSKSHLSSINVKNLTKMVRICFSTVLSKLFLTTPQATHTQLPFREATIQPTWQSLWTTSPSLMSAPQTSSNK